MDKLKKYILPIGLLLSFLLLTGCSSEPSSSGNKKNKQITLILDYIPNTNHSGIYVAQEKGYYADKGIDLNIIEPGDDSTSLALLGAGKGEFALSYQEDLTYATASKNPIPVKAVATVLQHNTSGFVALKSSGITSPKDFEGRVYAGWQSPSEEATLKAVMTKSGADYNKLTTVGDAGAGTGDLGKNVDIKWFFEGWDYTKAVMDGVELNYMPLNKLDDRLDFYTPILLTTDKLIDSDPELIQDFVDATKKGYLYAIEHSDESAEILHQASPDQDLAFLKQSQAFVSAHYTDTPESWGVMSQDVWDNYTDFMVEYQLIDHKIPAEQMFTNQFISKEDK